MLDWARGSRVSLGQHFPRSSFSGCAAEGGGQCESPCLALPCPALLTPLSLLLLWLWSLSMMRQNAVHNALTSAVRMAQEQLMEGHVPLAI